MVQLNLPRFCLTLPDSPNMPFPMCRNLGHLRLISNLLTAVIGPCPEAYEDDAMGSSDHQIHLITPDHLLTVATNGCTNECDSNPPLRSYLRSSKFSGAHITHTLVSMPLLWYPNEEEL